MISTFVYKTFLKILNNLMKGKLIYILPVTSSTILLTSLNYAILKNNLLTEEEKIKLIWNPSI